ncbi:MAG: LPS export ABC transporter periplasmic protein LptC [Magnetococcales bacterium]|nr:LPS export ABC transporter periplasmic protein LptC [Magnetococcales bacterium]
MRRPLKYLFLAASMAVILALALSVESPSDNPRAIGPVWDLATGERPLATGVQLELHDGVRSQWLLSAPSVRRGEGGVLTFQEPRLALAAVGGGETVVTAREGVVDEEVREMLFTGGVTVVEVPYRRLETESMRFVPSRRELSGDDRFRFSDRGLLLEGSGLVVYGLDRRLRVDRQVRLEFATDAGSLP